MLVLQRRLGEAIVIGGGVVVRVVEVTRGGQVRLGVEAPKSVSIHREEVQRAIERGRNDERRSREED